MLMPRVSARNVAASEMFVDLTECGLGVGLKCAACLDVLVARKLATAEQVTDAKVDLARIVRMMIGLLKRFSEWADVLKEEDGFYGYQQDQEHDQDQEQEGKA